MPSCMYECMYVCMYVCTCMHVFMYACMYVCMYVCIYVCIHTLNGRVVVLSKAFIREWSWSDWGGSLDSASASGLRV